MPHLYIYSPAKNVMQSGRAGTKQWLVEFPLSDRKEPDVLMGWNGSRDTRSQIRMFFPTMEAAIAYAKGHGHSYTVTRKLPRPAPKPKVYAENFRHDRIGSAVG